MALYKRKPTSSQYKANQGLVLLDSSARYYAHIYIKTKQYLSCQAPSRWCTST